MFEAAKSMPKGDWQAYSDCKAMFEHVPLTCDEYERTIKKLVDILEV